MKRKTPSNDGVSVAIYAVYAAVATALFLLCEQAVGLKMGIDVTASNSNHDRRRSSSSYPFDLTPTTSYLSSGSSDRTRRIAEPFSTSVSKAATGDVEVVKKKNAAPLVDSALLRFLATTKQTHRVEEPPVNETMISSSTNADAELSPPIDPRPSSTSSKTSRSTSQESIVPENESAPTKEFQSPARSNYWLSQFDSERVANVLVEAGADLVVAKNAGWEVQRYANDRARRLSIRRFLRNRDSLWANSAGSISSSSLGPEDLESVRLQKEAQSERNGRRGNIEARRGVSGDEDAAPGLGVVKNVVDKLLEAGLTGKDCAATFIHTPSLAMRNCINNKAQPREIGNDNRDLSLVVGSGAGDTLEETVDRALNRVLRGTLGLRKYDARKILRTCPGLLTRRGSLAAEQVVYLLSALGVSHTALARDKTALPGFLSRSPSSLFRLVAFLSSDAVRLPVETIGPMLRRPECAKLLNAVAPVPPLGGLASCIDTSGVCRPWDGDECHHNVNDAYRRMKLTAEFLRETIGADRLGKVISSEPSALLLDPHTQFEPVISYLRHDVALCEDDVSKMIQTFPALLVSDVDKMRQVVHFLGRLDLSRESRGKIFRAFPYLVSLDVTTKMLPVVRFLSSIGVANIGRFVSRLPPVLGYSVEDELVPKWNFLVKVCEFDYFEVVRFPAYFSYPLDKVIVPRYEYLRARGVPFKLISVDDVLRFGDADFATKIVGDRDGGELFARFVKERRKRLQQRSKIRKK